jgi:pullulanase
MTMKMKFLLILPIVLFALLILFRSGLFAQKSSVGKGDIASLAFNPFSDYPVYAGTDLGVTYTPRKTTLKVWSPPASAMRLNLYRNSTGNEKPETITCKKAGNGVWMAELNGDYKGSFYTFQAQIAGKWLEENPDPYAKAVGVNGKRGQIIDLKETDPPGWDMDKAPFLKNPTDVILYELHTRDLSVSPTSGITNKGKFLGFTESGTKNSHGESTGIDHIAEMGVTHVHLLPVFDFLSVDEAKPDVPQFNWGYDPQNFNVPEGSYSTDASDGKVRIREFKQMVMAMHRKGLRVVMDVVYNHTGRTHDSNFDQLVPGYYYRQWEKDRTYGNASGCGNETASDRAMVRKFMIESVVYWVKEYHIDGFRFDLMAVHDLETMNLIADTLHKIDPTILIYGEGWTAGDSPLPVTFRSLKAHAPEMNGIAVFSDDIRDGIKGSVFDEKSTGFASGSPDFTETVKFGIVAAGKHPQINYEKVSYSKTPYTLSPSQVINYVACHDNHTLYDKLKLSRPDASEADLLKMHKLANTIVITSQGIPFLHAGEEMKRTKNGEHNSYNKPDSVNQIDWNWKHANKELVDYYRSLIALRKAHPAFRMNTAEEIGKHLVFFPENDPHIIAYQLNDHANSDPWKDILVIFNGSGETKSFNLPEGNWTAVLYNYEFQYNGIPQTSSVQTPPYSAMILYKN